MPAPADRHVSGIPRPGRFRRTTVCTAVLISGHDSAQKLRDVLGRELWMSTKGNMFVEPSGVFLVKGFRIFLRQPDEIFARMADGA